MKPVHQKEGFLESGLTRKSCSGIAFCPFLSHFVLWRLEMECNAERRRKWSEEGVSGVQIMWFWDVRCFGSGPRLPRWVGFEV